MNQQFFINRLRELDPKHLPEFALANGIGGFCSGSITGDLFRKHHGYLVASLNPPTNRRVYLAKTVESISYSKGDYCFDSQRYSDSYDHGDVAMVRFALNPMPSFTYKTKQVAFSKKIVPIMGKNTVVISYHIESFEEGIVFQITPWLNDKEYGDASSWSASDFDVLMKESTLEVVKKQPQSRRILLKASTGRFVPHEPLLSLPTIPIFDYEMGDQRADYHFIPAHIELTLSPYQNIEVELACTIEELPEFPLAPYFDQYISYTKTLLDNAQARDEFERRLIVSSNQFIAHRASTDKPTILAGIPWFTDWGRDTMIAFPGLLLSTNRFTEAKDVLRSFITYQYRGLIPNMFPERGQEPLYNTVDASLWFVNAVYLYVKKTNDWKFVENELWHALQEIIHHYQVGTLFSIHMDQDGLIHAGSGNDQVTWMDVRINGYAVTPRHGKAVEINALWYNALCIMSELGALIEKDDSNYLELANVVKQSFNARFWNESTHCLYDVVDPMDASIRPNQLYAITLPFTVLSIPQMKSIVQVAKNELLDVYGIRSLSYRDPRFKQTYHGPLLLRDHCYHMGTSWGYLMGIYLESVLIANEHSSDAVAEVSAIYQRLAKHLEVDSLNGVAEVFDGYLGSISKGCHNQAWSVAEWLRVYKDYQLSMGGTTYETR
ncbi:MAG: amylo-alpha-1,6-glucosidase [bacterium]|nr:amylo-alpha-1,6-glucosidase [bacterium]